MSATKSLIVHGGLLVVAAATASYGWLKEDAPEKTALSVEVWAGKPDDIQVIRYEDDSRKVVLTAKSDERGRYYVGEVDKEKGPAKPPVHPDAGAKSPKPKAERETVRFVAVSAAEKLAKQLAPLEAFRRVGPYDAARAEEFGFHEPEGTLEVTIGSTAHQLTIGGTTPGGSDRYVKTGDDVVFAVPGAIARDLQYAESRLIERSLHDFEDDTVTKVKLRSGEVTRDLEPVDAKGQGWKSPGGSEDETASNWMSKLDRLRVQSYAPDFEPTPQDLVVRIDYFADRHALGYTEIYRAAAPGAEAKPDYYVKSEQTRWYAKVLSSTAQQLDEDLGSVVK